MGLLALCLWMSLPGWAADRAAASPVADESGFAVEQVSWLGRVDDDGVVSVTNLFGDLRVRFGGYEGVVEVVATLQHFADEGPPLVLDAKEPTERVTVGVGFRSEPGGEWINHRRQDEKKRADLVVFLPAGATLEAATEDGLLEIRKIKSDVRATTVGGEIIVRGIEGDLHLASERGDIVANLFPRQAGPDQSIVSGTGDVSVHLDDDVDLDIRVKTGGPISTDFSLRIDPLRDESGQKRGEALVGKGTTVLRVESAEGHVSLARRPLARRARIRPRPEADPAVAASAQDSEDGRAMTIRSQEGALEVDMSTMHTKSQPVVVETVTGDITLWVDPAADLKIDFETSGETAVDFTADIDFEYHEEPAKHGRILLGEGSTAVRLTSRRGTVSVLNAAESRHRKP